MYGLTAIRPESVCKMYARGMSKSAHTFGLGIDPGARTSRKRHRGRS